MTQRPAHDAPAPTGRDTATAVLDPAERLPERQPGGYYDPDSCSFEPADAAADGWLTLAVNVEPEDSVPARQR